MSGAVDPPRRELRALLGADGLLVGLEAAVAGLPWQAAGRAVDGLAHTTFALIVAHTAYHTAQIVDHRASIGLPVPR